MFVALWAPILLLISSLLAVVIAQQPIQTFFPASIPLAVRSPYFNAWQSSTNGTNVTLPNSWLVDWTQATQSGLYALVRVDGASYQLTGHHSYPPAVGAIVTNVQLTPTRSIFVMKAGPLNVTFTFLSPVEPQDWVKQSLPVTYVSIEFHSLDGAVHDVQVYCDVTGEWVSGDRATDSSGAPVQSSVTPTDSSMYCSYSLEQPRPFEETASLADDAKSFLATSSGDGRTWGIADGDPQRLPYIASGILPNNKNSLHVVCGLAIDLKNVAATTTPIAWAFSVFRDPVIDDVVQDFPAALARAVALDAQIMNAAVQISAEYVDLVSLATRLTMGTMEMTVGLDSHNNINSSDVMIFVKDIGSSHRINPVEKLYAAWPAYLYLNASLCGAILRPMLELQDAKSGQPYASTDIGSSYPNVTDAGSRGNPAQGIEESSNVLIMLYSYARFSGEGMLLAQHYNTTKRWADYLVQSVPSFSGQITADQSTPGANLTNLALKGIIAIRAMAEISHTVGNDPDVELYNATASTLINEWQSLAIAQSDGHILASYGDPDTSWTLAYNSWLLFTAATMTDPDVRDRLTHGGWTRANSNLTSGAFMDHYHNDGSIIDGTAGPSVGAMFSHLALQYRGSNTGAIVGGVVGGVVIIGLAVATVVCFRRRRMRRTSSPRLDIDAYHHSSPQGSYHDLIPHARATGDVRDGQTPPPSTGLASPAAAAVGEAPSEFSQSAAVSVTTTEVAALRSDVQDLRRAMHAMAERRLEPPPEYRPTLDRVETAPRREKLDCDSTDGVGVYSNIAV
ncbi:uncharacterized protein BXZ73DRAFT_88008 [Epithele typhae]|uniref:uncharacterized protein n=1 Tax=Epithele typhae TaxID=378194 RepID=UPI002007D5BD|nr:uncharacterized protein BXZ73DRAFT_88008 [Epithele typhae]KAH9942428.1 hypothetical protein BXZ73DRAFT_88008 [Epithele typhae]